MNSTVAAGRVIQIPGNHHLSGPEVRQSRWLYCEKGPAEAVFLRQLRKFNLPQELLKQFYSAIIESVLCSSITVWFGSATKTDIRRLQRTVRTAERIIVPLCPASKNFTPPEWGQGLRKSLWIPQTQLTLSLNCCPLAGATDHWAPKQPDTRTVFPPRPYPTWTTHNTPTVQYCTSVNNSSNLHLYIGHMHIHSSVYGHFFCLWTWIFLLLLLFLIIVYSLHY